MSQYIKKPVTELVQSISGTDVISVAMNIPGVHIERKRFLSKELRPYYSDDIVNDAICNNPAHAGIPVSAIDKIATNVINYETNKVSAISFVSGIPGGIAMLGTIPVDLAQYFGFVIRISQKLAYLYGFPEMDFGEENIPDHVMDQLLIFVGTMFGAKEAGAGLQIIAEQLAAKTGKTLANKALTKGTIYPIVKSVSKTLGFRMTKQVFADGVAKLIPVIGGVASGSITYATFKPSSHRLRKSLKSLKLCDPKFYSESI